METHDASGQIRILPLCFLGNIFWYSHLLSEARCLVLMNEPYRKQTLRNRMEIYGPQDRQGLTIPVKFSGSKPMTQAEIALAIDEKTRNQILRTLKTAYGSAPFFIHYADYFEELILGNYDSLLELNLAAHRTIMDAIPGMPELPLCAEIPSTGIQDLTGCFKTTKGHFETTEYPQIFESKFGYRHNLSIVDVLMHLGPATLGYLRGERNRTILLY